MIISISNQKTINTAYNGKDSITGKLSFIDSPAVPFCPIYLINQKSLHLVNCSFSDEKGNFKFNDMDLKKGPFFIVSHDPTGEHNGVIADNIGGLNYVDG